MKKKYEKPELFMESFEVSEFIASCEHTGGWTSNADRNHCGYQYTDLGLTFFTPLPAGSNCNQYPGGGNDGFPAYCYNGFNKDTPTMVFCS